MARKFQVIKCSSCGECVPNGNFCNKCGEVLPRAFVEREVMICGSCGRAVAKAFYCTACGMRQKAK